MTKVPITGIFINVICEKNFSALQFFKVVCEQMTETFNIKLCDFTDCITDIFHIIQQRELGLKT